MNLRDLGSIGLSLVGVSAVVNGFATGPPLMNMFMFSTFKSMIGDEIDALYFQSSAAAMALAWMVFALLPGVSLVLLRRRLTGWLFAEAEGRVEGLGARSLCEVGCLLVGFNFLIFGFYSLIGELVYGATGRWMAAATVAEEPVPLAFDLGLHALAPVLMVAADRQHKGAFRVPITVFP